MTRLFVDRDDLTGMVTEVDVNESEGTFRIVHSQDVTAALEYSKTLQNEPEYKRAGIKADFQHVAHIPDGVIVKWLNEGVNIFDPNHTEAVKRKLRDPEYRYLRTTLGRI